MANMKGKGIIVNRAELAGYEGVALTTVDAWVRDGCPVVQRGSKGVAWSFNTAQVSAWRRAREVEAAIGDAPATADELRLRRLAAETGLAELELSKARGDVVDREQVRTAATAAFTRVRAGVRSIPRRCAARIGGDEQKIARVILAEVDRVLVELAKTDLVTLEDLEGAEDNDAE